MRLRCLPLFLACLLAVVSPSYAQDSKEDAASYYKLGQAYYDQGRYKEAEDMFQKSLDILNSLEEKKQPAAQPAPSAQPIEPSLPQQPGPAPQTAPAYTPSRGEPAEPLELGGALEYHIGDQDTLKLSVWQNPDLDGELIVRPDGAVSVPLIGDLPATGKTITQLTRDISQRLTEFVKSPQVSLSISKIGGKRIIVLGQVTSPGIINAGGQMRIMDAIGMAGGFTRDAVPSSTVIIRGGFSGAKAQKINLSKVLAGDLSQNIALQSQDIIFVPRKFISDLNYVLEQVLTPLSRGAYITGGHGQW